MIRELDCSIDVSKEVIELYNPQFILYRGVENIVVEAFCCDTVDEAQEVKKRLQSSLDGTITVMQLKEEGDYGRVTLNPVC